MHDLLSACYKARKLAFAATICLVPILAGCVAVNVQGYTDDPTQAAYASRSASSVAPGADSRKKLNGLILNPSASDSVVTYQAAMDYLLAARRTLISKAQNRENIDTGTKIGMDVGLVGAVLKAPTTHSEEPVRNFLTLAAGNAKINDDINPLPVSLAYRAGAGTLDCVRSAAVLSHAEVGRIQVQLGIDSATRFEKTTAIHNLDVTIDAVRADIIRLNNDAYVDTDDVFVKNAAEAIANAKSAERHLASFLDEESMSEHMLGAVNTTLYQVNSQAFQRSPTTASIFRSSSLFVDYLQFGQDYVEKINKARNDTADAEAGADKSSNEAGAAANNVNALNFLQDRRQRSFTAAAAAQAQPNIDQLKKDLRLLNTALAEMPAVTTDHDVALITQCGYDGDDAVVSVDPDVIKLTIKGDAVTIKVNGAKVYGLAWQTGVAPEGVTYTTDKNLVIRAADNAKAGTFYFRIYSESGAHSGLISLVVAPKDSGGVAALDAPSTVPPEATGTPESALAYGDPPKEPDTIVGNAGNDIPASADPIIDLSPPAKMKKRR